MAAKLGRNPSYAWRSILAARDVLEKGMRWIIGNGKNVKIWEDRWLPIPISFKVCSPRRQGVDLAMVANLLDGEKGMWNIDKMKSTFLPMKLMWSWVSQLVHAYPMIP